MTTTMETSFHQAVQQTDGNECLAIRPKPWKVPQEEIERQKKAQLCFKCDRSGHFANECQIKTKEQDDDSYSNEPLYTIINL